MATKQQRHRMSGVRTLLVVLVALALVPGDTLAYKPYGADPKALFQGNAASKIPPDQLDSLVARVALYPDPLLAQVLAVSTYPLEIIQLQQWLTKKPRAEGSSTRRCLATALGSQRPGVGLVT